MQEAFRRINVHYFLINNSDPELRDVQLNDFISIYKDELKLIRQDGDFMIYSAI